MIRTISIGSCVSIQGLFVSQLADGKIVVAGSRVAEEGSSNMLVESYDASGVPDATFGAAGDDGTPEGFVNISLGDGTDASRDLALQAGGAPTGATLDALAGPTRSSSVTDWPWMIRPYN